MSSTHGALSDDGYMLVSGNLGKDFGRGQEEEEKDFFGACLDGPSNNGEQPAPSNCVYA